MGSARTGRRVPVPDTGLGELLAFVVVADERSFTRAASRLYLSQPGLSARIARLERAVGARLVDRTTRRVGLTPAGETLLPAAVAALETIELAVAVLSPRRDRATVG